MLNWIQDLFHVEKPIIAVYCSQPLPGDPHYDADGDIEKVVVTVEVDLLALQEGRVDGIMSSDEFNLPYLTEVESVTITVMVRVVGEPKPFIIVPYGTNCLRDPIVSIDLAVAVDGKFIRKIIPGVCTSDFGLWNTDVGRTVRHKMAVGAEDLKLFLNIMPEAARYLADRGTKDIVRSTESNNRPDTLCVFGLIAGSETDTQTPGQIKISVKHTPILCSTRCNVNSIIRQLFAADRAVYATTFRYGDVPENAVDVKWVKEFMDKVKEYRATFQGARMAGMNFKMHPKSGILHRQSPWYTKGIFQSEDALIILKIHPKEVRA